jgi:hypothetical protein
MDSIGDRDFTIGTLENIGVVKLKIRINYCVRNVGELRYNRCDMRFAHPEHTTIESRNLNAPQNR